ncbi:hypothetical protein Esti_001470 [Eimeria stiedai]
MRTPLDAAGTVTPASTAAAASPRQASAAREGAASAAAAAVAAAATRMQTRHRGQRRPLTFYSPTGSGRNPRPRSSGKVPSSRTSSSSSSSSARTTSHTGAAASVTAAASAAAAGAKKRRSNSSSSRRLEARLAAARAFWDRLLEELAEAPGKCDVCGGAESTEENAIVFCDACDVPVHLSCYGLDAVPPGDWFCEFCRDALNREAAAAAEGAPGEAASAAAAERCSSNSSSHGAAFPRCCCLCPRRSGALLQCKEGPWVHASCALWLPEVETVAAAAPAAAGAAAGAAAASATAVSLLSRGSLSNGDVATTSSSSSSRLMVHGCGSVFDERFEGACCLCLWTGGFLLQCATAGCSNSLHPTCARIFACGPDLYTQEGLLREGRRECLRVLCPAHQHLHANPAQIKDAAAAELHLHPVAQLWRLLQRSGDALQRALESQREQTAWGARVSALLLQAPKPLLMQQQQQQQREQERRALQLAFPLLLLPQQRRVALQEGNFPSPHSGLLEGGSAAAAAATAAAGRTGSAGPAAAAAEKRRVCRDSKQQQVQQQQQRQAVLKPQQLQVQQQQQQQPNAREDTASNTKLRRECLLLLQERLLLPW